MKKTKIIFILAVLLLLGGCSGMTPRIGAGMGMGVGVGFSGRKPVIRPYFHGGIGAGLFKFF